VAQPVISTICENGHHTHCHSPECTCEACHFTCPECGVRVKKLNDGVCAVCYRKAAKAQAPRREPCDECGRDGAVRNPRTRKNVFRCVECHAKHPEEPSLQLPASVGGNIATCAHLPLDDPAHEFLTIRSTRARCRRCQQDAFGAMFKRVNIVGATRSFANDYNSDVPLEEL
jgi:hypothetical protein